MDSVRGVLGGVGAAACQIVVTLLVPCFIVVASLLHYYSSWRLVASLLAAL